MYLKGDYFPYGNRVIVLRTLNRNSVPNTVMIGPKPDSVNMYMHIIGINFSKDETKEFEIVVLFNKKTTQYG
jgi:hypothetical protein